MRATRWGVSLMPGRSGSSPTPSRMSLTPFSIFFRSIIDFLRLRPPSGFSRRYAFKASRETSLRGSPFFSEALRQSAYSGWMLTASPPRRDTLIPISSPRTRTFRNSRVEDPPLDGIEADPDRARLPEDGLDQGLHFISLGEQGQFRGQPVLLHDDGGEKRVEGPELRGPVSRKWARTWGVESSIVASMTQTCLPASNVAAPHRTRAGCWAGRGGRGCRRRSRSGRR